MTKFLMLNVGWTNKGNCALAHSTMETIKRFIPNVEFILMGTEVGVKMDSKLKKQVASGQYIRKPYHALIPLLCMLKCVFIHIFKKFGVHIPISKNSRLFEYYNNEVLINSGGDQTSGEHGFGLFNGI